MNNELNQNDHDILVRLHENIELNFRQVKADIKDLKDGTSNQLADHEARIKDLEVTRVDFRAKIRDTGKYMAFIVALGLLIIGLLIWHITGGSGGYHI